MKDHQELGGAWLAKGIDNTPYLNTPPKVIMEGNVEYRSLAKFTTTLSTLLQHNIVTVSGQLLEKGLVTKDVYDSILSTESVSSQKNAARLVSCVLDRVKTSAKCFQEFVDVLRQDSYNEVVVVKILAVYGEML